jgi:16S rRNA (uracil1498-N3)-methyltransferase
MRAQSRAGRSADHDVLGVARRRRHLGATVAILDADAAQSLAAHAAAARPGTIAAGPEGGFASEELQRAMEQGALPAHLGPRVLRAETAALAALATINAVAGDAR